MEASICFESLDHAESGLTLHVFDPFRIGDSAYSRIGYVFHRNQFFHIRVSYMSNEKNPGWLGYIDDYTTQLYRYYQRKFRSLTSDNMDS